LELTVANNGTDSTLFIDEDPVVEGHGELVGGIADSWHRFGCSRPGRWISRKDSKAETIGRLAARRRRRGRCYEFVHSLGTGGCLDDSEGDGQRSGDERDELHDTERLVVCV